MSKYHIEITEPAEEDLHEIGRYIAIEHLEPGSAQKVVQKIGDTILTLEELPSRNAMVTDERLTIRGIQKIIVDNYIVFYIIYEEQKTIIVVRILYDRRDWINLI